LSRILNEDSRETRVRTLATLADYIRALGGELKVIADFGDTWRRVA